MKSISPIAAAALLAWLTGCASAPRAAVSNRLGPCHPARLASAGEGTLQVYSATASPPLDTLDPSAGPFFWNYAYGRNDFLAGGAHADYSLYAADGRFLQRVCNSRNPRDPEPTLLKLPPGSYIVKAEAQDYPVLGANLTIAIPVAIEPGETTTVHLQPNWTPAEETDPARAIRLADGRVIGCRSEPTLASQAAR